MYAKTIVLSCFHRVWLFVTLWTVAHCPWDSTGKDTGVGCYTLFQGTFPTQGLTYPPLFPALQADSFPIETRGKDDEGLIIQNIHSLFNKDSSV